MGSGPYKSSQKFIHVGREPHQSVFIEGLLQQQSDTVFNVMSQIGVEPSYFFSFGYIRNFFRFSYDNIVKIQNAFVDLKLVINSCYNLKYAIPK